MNAHSRARRTATMLLGLVVLLVPAVVSLTEGASTASAHDTFADPAFQRVWSHCDKPVEAQVAARSWMWGPEDFYSAYESYAEGPGGLHLVSYFDKSRMEVNDPSGNRNSEWFVTNGLLVVDMIAGRIQVGNNMFAPAPPANIAVAGDQPASLNAPTYATLANVASLNNDHRSPDRTGQFVREGLGRAGNVGSVSAELANLTRNVMYEPTLGHNIPDVFWAFMNQRGTTYHENGYMPNDLVVDWMFAMGYPITEPYWIQISVAGQQRWVLMQAFQRRVLTYSPYNPEGWKVEMGNVGRAYYDWRYVQNVQPIPTSIPAPVPTATPRPGAHITINPTSGDTNTTITVTGANFPGYAAVTIGVEKPSANYARGITTVAARADGSFTAQFKLPADAANLGEVTIVASANGGAVRATAGFRLNYEPTIEVSQSEVVANAAIRVQGRDFPAQTGIKLLMLYTNGNSETLISFKTDKAGSFDVSPAIAKPVGTQFRVVAMVDGGMRVTSQTVITVIRQPVIWVTPDRGPVGVNVVLNGSNWPANRAIKVGLRAVGSASEAWLPNPAYTDGQGNFATTVPIGREFAQFSEIRLSAYDQVSLADLEASYYVTSAAPTPTPPPPPPAPNPSIVVAPNVVAVGQVVEITGSGWPGGAQVSIGIGRAAVEEPLGVATANGAGKFLHRFVLSSRWENSAQLIVTAYIPSRSAATTSLWVAPHAPRVAPGGLPMDVWVYRTGDGQVHIYAKGQNWPTGTLVNAWIFSPDGALTVPLGSDTVNADGGFTAGGLIPAGTWQQRTDLGIKASSPDGTRWSIRYLPYTEMAKVPGTGNTYEVLGRNWPGNSMVKVVLKLKGQPEDVIGTATTDPLGQYSLQVQLPRIPSQNKNDVQITVPGQPYTVIFDF